MKLINAVNLSLEDKFQFAECQGVGDSLRERERGILPSGD